MKTITLPVGTESVRFDELAHLIALAMWPLRDDGSPGDGLNFGFASVTLERELAQAVAHKEIPIKDPLTLGKYKDHPGGTRLEDALVLVDDLRKYVAERGLVVEVLEPESPVMADAEESEPVSPEFEKWRLLWRAVSFDENRVKAAINELEHLPPKGISEIAFRNENRASLREEFLQIAGRKDWLASQMGFDMQQSAERRFTIEEMAESRQPPDRVRNAERDTEIALINQEIDALIAERQGSATEADQTEVVEQVPSAGSYSVEQVPLAPPSDQIFSQEDNGPTWSLITSLMKTPGYRWPLYQFLTKAHVAGESCPKAVHVLEAWEKSPPPGIRVIRDGRRVELEYELETGHKKTTTLKQIQAAITGLLAK